VHGPCEEYRQSGQVQPDHIPQQAPVVQVQGAYRTKDESRAKVIDERVHDKAGNNIYASQAYGHEKRPVALDLGEHERKQKQGHQARGQDRPEVMLNRPSLRKPENHEEKKHAKQRHIRLLEVSFIIVLVFQLFTCLCQKSAFFINLSKHNLFLYCPQMHVFIRIRVSSKSFNHAKKAKERASRSLAFF
jgi:hypothetical protein